MKGFNHLKKNFKTMSANLISSEKKLAALSNNK